MLVGRIVVGTGGWVAVYPPDKLIKNEKVVPAIVTSPSIFPLKVPLPFDPGVIPKYGLGTADPIPEYDTLKADAVFVVYLAV